MSFSQILNSQIEFSSNLFVNICVNSKQYLPLSPEQICDKIKFLKYVFLIICHHRITWNIERENQYYRLMYWPHHLWWSQSHLLLAPNTGLNQPIRAGHSMLGCPCLTALLQVSEAQTELKPPRAETQAHSQTKNRWFWQRIEFDGCSKMKWVSNRSLGCNQNIEILNNTLFTFNLMSSISLYFISHKFLQGSRNDHV